MAQDHRLSAAVRPIRYQSFATPELRRARYHRASPRTAPSPTVCAACAAPKRPWRDHQQSRFARRDARFLYEFTSFGRRRHCFFHRLHSHHLRSTLREPAIGSDDVQSRSPSTTSLCIFLRVCCWLHFGPCSFLFLIFYPFFQHSFLTITLPVTHIYMPHYKVWGNL